MALEVFKLFGTIMVNNDEANKSISATEGKAEGLGKKLLGGIGTAAKWAAGIAAAAGTVAVAIGTVAVKATDEYHDALNKLQVQTGYSDKYMQQFGETIKNVYANNFGESFDDVAQAIAKVNQNTRLMGDELEHVTELALGFRDAFGYDVEESTRAAKALMDQFGVSAEEAFNLMVQGEQQGLDYSGELIDSINEYSVHFAQLGLSAEDMFNVFIDGAGSGAFNLDKIGDAVKELGIRIKEGSANEALQELGFSADEVVNKFNEGGDSAREAFYGIFEALGKVDDQTKLNTLGTALMGTMYEDLGKEAVLELGQMSDCFSRAADSADQMNEIQYDSFGNAVKGIKRQMETNILIPLGEAILPTLNKFSNWFATDGVEYLGKFSDFISTVFTPIGNTIKDAFGVVLDVVSNLLSVFTDNTDGMEVSWDSFLQGIKNYWDTVGKPMFDAVLNVISSLVTNAGPILEGLKTAWNTVIDYITTYWDSIGKPMFDFFVESVNKLADVFNKVFPVIANIFSGVMDTLSLFWENIGKPVLQAVGDFVSNSLLPKWRFVFDLISKVVVAVFQAIGNWWNTILKPVLDGIILFVGGIFKGNWSQVWEGIKSILSGIWESFKQTMWGPIEWVLSKVKGIVEPIVQPFRDAASAIGEVWSSIKSKFKLPHFKLKGSLNPMKWVNEGMPKFDVEWYSKGAIFTQPTILSSIGVGDADNGRGSNAEAVIPLDKLWDKLDGIINRPIILQAGNGKELMRFLAKYQDEFRKYDLGRSVT